MKNDMILDAWSVETTELDEFCDTVKELTTKSEWFAGIPSDSLRIEATDGPLVVQDVIDKCACEYDVAYDTCENTHLLVNTGLKTYCLRDTAMSSLLTTAKIQGSALGRLSYTALSEVLNYCLQVAKGSSLMLHQAGKVSAILSDNAGGYRVMPQDRLVDIALTKMAARFGGVRFQKGLIDHASTTFWVELPNAQKELNNAYNAIIGRFGRQIELMPAVQFLTSDTGASAATLKPVFRPVGESFYYPVGTGLRVEHIRSKDGSKLDGIDKFAAEAEFVHAKFDETQETIGKMAKTVLQNPLNAYIAITKKIGIAQKYAKEGYEDLESYCLGNPCSVHDLYLSLTRCLGVAAQKGVNRSVQLALEDAVARVFTLRWEDYDMPGVVAWNAAA